MEFMIPKKSPSSFTEPSMEAGQQRCQPGGTTDRCPVTRCLRLKLSSGDDRSHRSVDKDLLLRRIRHHRWTNRMRGTLLAVSLELSDAGGDCSCHTWTQEDTFSFA